MQRLGKLDATAYLRAFVQLFRHPQIALGPILASLAVVLLLRVFPADAGAGFLGSANASIVGLVGQLIDSFGLAVALEVADAAWRRGPAPFSEAWEESRRKAGDILLAAIGFGFVTYVAGVIGSFVPLIGPLVLMLLAYFFFIYTLPAAAIGGVPGGGALQISFERARGAPLPTFVVTAVYLFAFFVVPMLIVNALAPFLVQSGAFSSGVGVSLVVGIIKALASAYVALVLAKTYADVSYGRFGSW